MAHIIRFGDLEFEEVPYIARSSSGAPYRRWLKVGMPKIPDQVLKCAVYLYPTAEAARAGQEFGGSGFLVGIQSKVSPYWYHLYAVSNWHVACRDGHSVVRINKLNSEIDIRELDPAEWEYDPDLDIAVVSLGNISMEGDGMAFVDTAHFITQRVALNHEIGPGDDVFMVGRFIDHDGGDSTNRPAVRFGNISVMPAPIVQPNNKKADSYCLDLHSRTGYSGSAVFMFRAPGQILQQLGVSNQLNDLMIGHSVLGLLGIHWGQFPEEWDIERREVAESASPAMKQKEVVVGLSGMTCALPAWDILAVLNRPKLADRRANDEEDLRREFRAQSIPIPEAE